MKIIAKVKDYYDYLKGIYGEDPKLVLNRDQAFVSSKVFNELSIITFIIGGKLVQIYFNGEDFFFGEDLKQFDTSKKWTKKEGYYRVKIGYLNGRKNDVYIADNVKEGFDYINEKHNCPILYRSDDWHCHNVLNESFTAFPLLTSTAITKFIPAEEVYKWLSEYLAKQLDKSLDAIPHLTDTQKLENKGFDKIVSFRPHIKNK